jgi:hypothetical protein
MALTVAATTNAGLVVTALVVKAKRSILGAPTEPPPPDAVPSETPTRGANDVDPQDRDA